MPGIRLEITVDDKGTPVVRQFNQEIGKSPSIVRQSEQSFLSSGASALRFAGALTGVQLGAQAVAEALQVGVKAVVGFEAGLANVATLGIRSAETQQRLRTELLQLPAILGSSTELATGLYEVLSSGIAPTEAVKFLGQAAMLAQAGLAQLDTSTVALTKTMAAYNLPASEAGRVSDILFRTVEVGQGSLQQFAGALPQVTQLSASMGISLEDTANALATLSQTFRNADTAATGFRSLLQQLLTNGDKFLALGINIRQVISEQGLLGAVKVLQQVSQGSSERLRTFVNDVEGFNAALALTGPQFQTLVQNQEKFRNTTGSVAEAVRLQAATTASAWKEFVNTVDKSVQALGPSVTTVLTTVLKGATTVTKAINENILGIPQALDKSRIELEKIAPAVVAVLKQIGGVLPGDTSASVTQVQSLTKEIELLRAAAKKAADQPIIGTMTFAQLGEALRRTSEWRDETVRASQAQGEAYRQVTTTNVALQAFDAALEALTKRQALTTAQINVFAGTLETSLRGAAASGLVATTTLQKGATDAADAIRDRLGQLTPGLREIVAQIERTGQAAPVGFAPVARLLREVDEQGQVTLRTFRELGGSRPFVAAEAAVPRVTQVIRELDEAGKTVLRTVEVFGPATEQAFARRGVPAVRMFSAEIEKATEAITNALIESGQQAGGFARNLTEAQIRAAADLGLISRQARDTALSLRQAGRDGGQGLAEGIDAGAESATLRLRQVEAQARETARNLKIVFQQAFGDTPRQLFEQLADQRTRFANAVQTASLSGVTEPGNFEALVQQIRNSASDAIFLITERLKTFGLNADGSRIATEALTTATADLASTTTQLTTVTTGLGQVLQQTASGPVLSLGAGFVMAAAGAQALIDRQRELLLLGAGSQITDAPGRGLPVSLGGSGGNLGPLLVPRTPGLLVGGGGGSLLSPADLGLNLNIPTQPGGASLVPIRIPAARPPGLGGFPSPTGNSGVTITSAPTTAGALLTGSEQTFQGGQGDLGRGGVITGTGTRNVTINVSTMALTRGGAQELASALGPALRELQRRGEL